MGELVRGRPPQTTQLVLKKVVWQVRDSCTVLAAIMALALTLLMRSILPLCLLLELVPGRPLQTIQSASVDKAAWLIRGSHIASPAPVVGLQRLPMSIFR